MNEIILFAGIGEDLAQTATNVAEKFGLNGPLFIAQVISYKPILDVLAQRRQRIAESLANAEKIKQELAKTEAARQEVLNQTNAQANKLIEEARAAAARVQEQETQKAVAAAEQIIAKAREAAAADHARMLIELKREIGRLVVQTTGRVSGKILTSEDQQRLAEETNKQLAA
ncbi:MAG: ATP synthase F0 subunit B [Verrucomicrobia bacterium]|nr:MAG: ATP synthase F0 subunit B [Verrucomicrobiota bacterium]